MKKNNALYMCQKMFRLDADHYYDRASPLPHAPSDEVMFTNKLPSESLSLIVCLITEDNAKRLQPLSVRL